MTEQNDDFFSQENEATSGFFSFKNIGDKIKGIYVGQKEIPAKGIFSEQIGYILKTENGLLTAAFGISKKQVHEVMNNARIGQEVGFKYTGDFETEASKNNPKISPAHTIKVYLGQMSKAEQIAADTGGTVIDTDSLPF